MQFLNFHFEWVHFDVETNSVRTKRKKNRKAIDLYRISLIAYANQTESIYTDVFSVLSFSDRTKLSLISN